MKILHHSQNAAYRSPLGAVPTGSRVKLCILAESDTPIQSVTLRLFCGQTESQIPMEPVGGSALYTATIAVGDTPCLIWYDFILTASDRTYYYCNNPERLGGEGSLSDTPSANGYQITVYDQSYQTPDWFRGRIMYQIFPDRFWGEHPDGIIPQKRAEYAIHYDRYEPLAGHRHPFEDGPACDDFYGGNLKGIQAKLPYLQSLGVGVLYLNPIFDAYSNHKYDTADYKTIDPMFGTEDDFRALCQAAESYGIRVILDGVFSHTGADSIYFNKYGTYGESSGAYRDPSSPYRDWYQFSDYPNYHSWWGCSNLPNVNEMTPSYLDYILKDDDAVIKKWIHNGAYGWRLDVADELPDKFIRILRTEAKKANPDAVVIGEVWEDASNKTAYGVQREYLLGHELDSVMNYPFKDGVLAYLMHQTDAAEFNRRVLSQMENYPKPALYALMNILGTHDTMRLKSYLGGMDESCTTERLSSGMESLATAKIRLGAFLQMTFYGVPCIYYGDEVGMEGGKDPYNRGTYPWSHVDSDLREWYAMLGTLRNRTECLKHGFFTPLFADGDVYVYARHFTDGTDPLGNIGDDSFALCAVNRSTDPQTVSFSAKDFSDLHLVDAFGGEPFTLKEETTVSLPPLLAKLWLSAK